MTEPASDVDFKEWSFWQKIRRRKLRNYLFLDKKLQFNFALLLAVIGGINAFYFSFLFYFYAQDSFERVARYIPEYAFTESMFQQETQNRLITVFFIGAFQLVLVLLLGLFFSHRIAGPLYAMSNKLKDLAKGEMPSPVRLRKNDLLTAFADQFNETIDTLSTQRHEIESAIHELDGGNLQAAKSHLRRATEPALGLVPASKDDSPPTDTVS